MIFHVFKDTSDPRHLALTADEEGASLLAGETTWLYWKSFEGGLESRIGLSLEDEAAAKAEIEEHGYYLQSMPRILISTSENSNPP